MTITIDGTNGITYPDTTIQPVASRLYRTRALYNGTTYTVASDVAELYVFVYGATGGVTAPGGTTARGGVGGSGYSEKYYSSPASSYSYSIGAAGANTGTAGGTTTFDVISVTGSGGVTGTAGSSGGVGSGGNFNATGGTGGNGATGSSASRGGGSGGSATRAGNGGNGSNASGGTYAGAGGGTGGNNASTTTGGAAATAASGSALVLPFGQSSEFFAGGASTVSGACGSAIGGYGAQSLSLLVGCFPGVGWQNYIGFAQFGRFATYVNLESTISFDTITSAATGGAGAGSATAYAGTQGFIIVVEVCKK